MFVRKLSIQNIRSIRDVEIPLKKFNVLIGKNASGKSSILFSLLALRGLSKGQSSSPWAYQTMEWLKKRGEQEPMRVVLQGTYEGENDSLNFTLDSRFKSSLAHNSRLYIEQTDICEMDLLSWKQDTRTLRVLENLKGGVLDRIRKVSERSNPYGCGVLFKGNDLLLINENPQNLLADWPNYDYDFFAQEDGQSFQQVRESIQNFIRNMEFVPVSRGSFSIDSEQLESRPRSISDGANAPNEFLNMMIYPDFITKGTRKRIKNWAEKFGIRDFQVVIQPGKRVEGRGWLKKKRKKLPLALYGFGSNQFIHVIAKCVFAARNSPVMIEEPEIHLHPAFQALATDFLIETMNEGHQVFVATHSEHLIGRLQRRIADGSLSSEDVAILWVCLDDEAKGTYVEAVEMNEQGIIHEGLRAYLGFLEDEMTETELARHHKNRSEG